MLIESQLLEDTIKAWIAGVGHGKDCNGYPNNCRGGDLRLIAAETHKHREHERSTSAEGALDSYSLCRFGNGSGLWSLRSDDTRTSRNIDRRHTKSAGCPLLHQFT